MIDQDSLQKTLDSIDGYINESEGPIQGSLLTARYQLQSLDIMVRVLESLLRIEGKLQENA